MKDKWEELKYQIVRKTSGLESGLNKPIDQLPARINVEEARGKLYAYNQVIEIMATLENQEKEGKDNE